jgi:phospholipid/cholesterol/gamma-HCH transport system substrate-binding protein
MNSDRKTELLVGLFLLAGLVLSGVMVLKFGKVRDYFQGTYTKLVQFDDATGIRIGSPVALGGQRVGKVKTEPVLNPPNYNTVTLELEIFSTYPMPEKVAYEIATSGLLGDSYIAIRPCGQVPQIITREDGSTVVKGTKAAGIDTLTSAATDITGDIKKVLADVGGASGELKSALTNVNRGALSEATLSSFRNSITNLESASRSLDKEMLAVGNSEALKRALADVSETAAALKRTSLSIEEASKKIGPTLDKLDPVLASMTKASKTLDATLKSFQSGADNFSDLTRTMAKGDGLFRALLTDAELRDDFKSLIDNLRRHGVVWGYKDDAEKVRAQEAEGRARPSSRR